MMSIQIVIDGNVRTVSMTELSALAGQGVIKPDTELNIDGVPVSARNVPGLDFSPFEQPQPFPPFQIPIQNAGYGLPQFSPPSFPQPSNSHPPYGYGIIRNPHSRMGIASFIIALSGALMTFCVIAMAVFYAMAQPEEFTEESVEAVIVGLGIIACLGIEFVAFCLGIAAFFTPNTKKVFGILGIIFSGFTCLGTLGLIVLGLMMG